MKIRSIMLIVYVIRTSDSNDTVIIGLRLIFQQIEILRNMQVEGSGPYLAARKFWDPDPHM